MAESAPVNDVLCGAIEYLLKLGSNLKQRSEVLKNKRIRKDKLQNTHAIQKATSKVLLLCELSKKSIVNVESTVNAIRAQIVSSQQNKSDRKPSTDENVTRYEYIIYNSKRLKILKKVDIKHYASAKVCIPAMPATLQERYPVFYDCKLFRLRKRADKLSKESTTTSDKEKEINKENDTHFNTGPSNELQFEHDSSHPQLINNYQEKKQINAEENIEGSPESTNNIENEQQVLHCDEHVNLNEQRTPSSDSNEYKEKVDKCSGTKEDGNGITKDSRNITKNTVRTTKSNTLSEEKTTCMKDKNGKNQAEIRKEITSRISDINKKHHKEKDKNLHEKSHIKKPSKTFKKIVIAESSDEEKDNSDMGIDSTSGTNKCSDLGSSIEISQDKSEVSETIKPGNVDASPPEKILQNIQEINKSSEICPQNEVSKNESQARQRSCDSDKSMDSDISKKSYIKCVNISTLLKPDKIVQNIDKGDKQTHYSNKSRTKPKHKSSIENNPQLLKEEEITASSQLVYYTQLGVEKSFQPKSFQIHMVRLPKVNRKFLKRHRLRTVYQVFPLTCKISDPDWPLCRIDSPVAVTYGRKTKTLKTTANNTDMNSIKENLLNVSDSEKSNEDIKTLNEKVKKSLLCESDSEKSTHIDAQENLNEPTDGSKNTEKIDKMANGKINTTNYNKTLSDSNSEADINLSARTLRTPDISETVETNKDVDTNNVVITNSSKESNNKRKCEFDGSPQPAKKVLESIDAKKMLLTYSSSDSEDEKLRNTCKNIQEALLKSDSSSDETNAKENVAVTCPSTNESKNNDKKSDSDSSIEKSKENVKDKDLCYSKDTSKPSTSHNDKQNVHSTEHSSDTECSSKLKNKPKVANVDEKNNKTKAKESSESERSSNHKKQRTKDKIKKEKVASSSSDSESSSKQSKKSKEQHRHKRLKKKRDKASSSDMSQADDSTRSSSKMGRSKDKSASSGQVSQNEDSDKDIKGLIDLRSLKRVYRRRRSWNSRSLRSRSAKMPKAPVLNQEVLLQAESSSDAASIASNDGEVEELPRVPVTGLNGDGVDHLAKDDLLGDSDSSSSHNQTQNSHETKGETDDENVKRQRRKAIAISSDSEAGSSRRKKRLSDFEDSEDESEPTKKSKRKKKVSDSDASGDSGDERKKKRRRIKNVDDSEGSGSETENEGRNKHGRKNIRKVMGKNQLEEATKKAAREEKERIARIAERQKLYNNLQFDESGKPDEVVLDKVVLDFDPETKEPLIEVDKGLVKKLKPHQANGIKFMWDACFESVKRIKKDKGSGCILAHCMGLGKTLQVVSLTHTLLTHSDLTKVNRVLVVCPLSTVLNWVNEFKMWLKYAETDCEVDVYELSRFKQNSDRAFQLQQWFQHGGVCVLGYEMFRNLSSDNTKKFKKKMLKNFQESLVDPGPDLVVCDEGHLLKNEKTSLSQAMNKVKTLRRIVLTGTPLQNNLKEYYCMVQFVKPNLLGKYNEYLNRFVNPITNGQYTDSTEHDIRIMKRRSHVLHKMLDGAVQRRDYGVLAPFLPPKHEYVLFITLSEVQTKLYQHYLDNYSRRPLAGKSSGFLFPDFQSLQRIWTHPLVLKYNSERYEIMQQKKREREEEDSEGSLKDFIDDESTSEEESTEESTDDSSVMSDDSRKKSKKKSPKNNKPRTTKRGTRANPVEADDDDIQEVVEVKNENPTEWWMPLVSEEELDDIRNSPKLMLLFDILRQCEAIGDKLLVFSQSLYSLDLIEHFLGKVDEATQEARVDEKLGGHVGSWTPGLDYFRLDGSTSCENRSIWCRNFNRDDNPRSRLFLISTRAGGLGINLVAANRVVIFDVSWNPSHDVQSIFRVYRFGQKKPCYIYRFLAMGTMEEKIYERQVTKQAISKRVIDEQQIDRHYAENDLAELYKFEPTPPQPRPIPPLPKDRLFAEMLKEHEQLIYKYHEHDSLLENKEEETLTEEERKAAWEDFENEKTRPPPVPFTSAYTGLHNGMMPGFLNMQQQTLDYIAMLRKGAPDISDNQIRAMLPLLYSSHPGFMQKMSDLYKMQAGMMNPSMMNSGSGGGGGSGGMPMGATSGLQYEPPWQRQQQMRLQQVMQQQQSSMGAKFYAGGLGSRDPVAMALQHQRAREMMLGERSGRPRGRPPLAKPKPPPHDIVNLDSD